MARKVMVNGLDIGYIPPSAAADVVYNNTASGLEATDVQDAIDELAAKPSGAGGTYYATCSTAAATAAKVATVSADQGFVLKTGIIVVVQFSYENTAAGVTLNINNTGAKYIFQLALGSQAVKPNAIRANDKATLFYDGTYYKLISTQRGSAEIWTPSVSAAVGATTVTISHTAILANSDQQVINVYSRNTSETCIGITSVVTTAGQAVVTLAEALTVTTAFRLKITYI